MLVGARNTAHDLHALSSVTFVHGAKFVPTATHSVSSNSFELHTDVKTLLEATVWTAFTLGLVDMTAAICNAGVYLLVLHCALEESFAALAGEQAIVIAAGKLKVV